MHGKEIFELKEEGLTHKEIAEKLVLTKEQVKNFVKREHRKKRKTAAGLALKKRGRPPKGDKFSKWSVFTGLKSRHSTKRDV